MTKEPAASLTPEQFNRACELFGRAVSEGVTPEGRQDFVDEHASDDPAVGEQVVSMLAFHHKDAHGDEAATLEDAAAEAIRQETIGWTSTPFPDMPERIGPFRIIRHIATGGMGAVFEAEQEEPQRRVALKLIRTDMLGPQTVQRFEREAAVLARLTHPGIARVYTMGRAQTPTGVVPYLVMEYVEGEIITDHVRGRQLDTRQILELLGEICGAVHYAHRRGIIHRDLKPNNILVDTEGRPRILDFGIARVLDDEAAGASQLTGTGIMMGTLNYMSPEMVRTEDDAVHVRVDVYALAAVGFELLTGKPPANLSELTPLEALARVSEGDAPRLDESDKRYRGDLTVIFEKALAAKPQQRYGSMDDFGEDIQRFLDRAPIAARPFSRGYYLRRFIGRHKALVAAAAITLLSLTAGLIYALLAQGREARAREAAEAHAARSQALEHAASVKVVAAALRAGQNHTAYEALKRSPANAASWEHAYLDARLHSALEVKSWPPKTLLERAYVLSPGDYIVSDDHARNLRILDTDSGVTHELEMRANIGSFARSVDGKRLIVRVGDQWDVFDLATRRKLHTLASETPLGDHAPGSRALHILGERRENQLFDIERGVRIRSPHWPGSEAYGSSWSVDMQGRLVWTSHAGDILVASPASKEPDLRIDTANVRPAAFHIESRGRWIASRRGTVVFWNTRDGSKHWRVPRLLGDTVTDVAFDADSDRAALLYQRGTVRLVDVARRTVLGSAFDGRFRFEAKDRRPPPTAIRFQAPNRLVTVSPSARATWHARAAQDIPRVLQHFKREADFPFVYAVAFHPAGRFLASAAWDGRAVIWDAWTGTEISRHVFKEAHGGALRIAQVLWSDDGSRILVHAIGGDYRIVDPWTGRLVDAGRLPSTPLRFSKGRTDEVLVRWDTGIRRVKLPHTEDVKLPGLPRLPDQAPDWIWPEGMEEPQGRHYVIRGSRAAMLGSFLGGGGRRRSVLMWERGDPTSVRAHEFDSEVLGLTMSPAGDRLFIGLRNGSVVVWNTQKHLPALELTEHDGYVIGLALSPLDGTLATASEDGTVRLWHTTRMAERVARAAAAREAADQLQAKVLQLLGTHGSLEAAAALLRKDVGLSSDEKTAALAVLAGHRR